jgi:soluble lytic murein transglycosylase-like protein
VSRQPLLIAAVLCVALAAPARADVWSYTDADGVVHFTNVKPRGKGAHRWKRVTRGAPTVAGVGDEGVRDDDPRDVVPARDRSPERYARYDQWIAEAAALYHIPEELVRAVIKVESDYDPRVVSDKGARGLMQLMPSAAGQMRVDDAHDPRENIFGGVRYLRILANRFDGDLVKTIAAYHSGPANVAKHDDVPPYPRVQFYVRSVLRRYQQYREAGRGAPAAVD